MKNKALNILISREN